MSIEGQPKSKAEEIYELSTTMVDSDFSAEEMIEIDNEIQKFVIEKTGVVEVKYEEVKED